VWETTHLTGGMRSWDVPPSHPGGHRISLYEYLPADFNFNVGRSSLSGLPSPLLCSFSLLSLLPAFGAAFPCFKANHEEP